ncbi:MAG: nucleotidyltransferase family protein [Oricola sp.]|jgi:molybdenum cofactor cytidylyltransferase|nr:nucleotidyltransferase family protein [Oricola sp.]
MTGGGPAAILLAAGASARYGGDKLAALIDGDSVLSHAAQAVAASGCARRAAIVSSKSAVHAPLLKTFGFETVLNLHADEGLSSSLREGVVWAARENAESVLVALADMPFVPPAHLRALIAHSHECEEGAAFTTADGRRSVPAVFGSQWFETLRALEGDAGARSILKRLPDALGVEAPAHYIRDIDTPQDLHNSTL